MSFWNDFIDLYKEKVIKLRILQISEWWQDACAVYYVTSLLRPPMTFQFIIKHQLFFAVKLVNIYLKWDKDSQSHLNSGQSLPPHEFSLDRILLLSEF